MHRAFFFMYASSKVVRTSAARVGLYSCAKLMLTLCPSMVIFICLGLVGFVSCIAMHMLLSRRLHGGMGCDLRLTHPRILRDCISGEVGKCICQSCQIMRRVVGIGIIESVQEDIQSGFFIGSSRKDVEREKASTHGRGGQRYSLLQKTVEKSIADASYCNCPENR